MTKSEAKVKSVVETPSAVKAPVKLVAKPATIKPTLVVKRVINPLMPRQTDQTLAARQSIHLYESARP